MLIPQCKHSCLEAVLERRQIHGGVEDDPDVMHFVQVDKETPRSMDGMKMIVQGPWRSQVWGSQLNTKSRS